MDVYDRLWLEKVIEDLAQPYLDKEYFIPDVAIDLYLKIAPLGFPEKNMLSVKEVSELLGVHQQTIRRLAWYGKIEAIYVKSAKKGRGEKKGWGKRVMIPIGSLLAFVIKNSLLNDEA